MNHQKSIENIVQRLRKRFLIEREVNKELYHELDVSRVRTDDWQIERFFLLYDNEDKAYEAFLKAIKWKKSFGIHERTDQYFPNEYFEWSETHNYGRDREGRLIIWEKHKNDRNILELKLLTKQFIAHMFEKNDTTEHKRGFTIVSDINGASLINLNMEVIKFRIELNQYYPGALKRNIVVDLPLILSSAAKLILSFSDQTLKDRVHFTKRKDLNKYMDAEVIPVEMGGNRKAKMFLPENLKTMRELSRKLSLTEKVVKTYYQSFGQKY